MWHSAGGEFKGVLVVTEAEGSAPVAAGVLIPSCGTAGLQSQALSHHHPSVTHLLLSPLVPRLRPSELPPLPVLIPVLMLLV